MVTRNVWDGGVESLNLSGETSAFSLIELDIISILILLGLDIELPLLESPLLYSFYALIAQMVEQLNFFDD